MSSRLNIEEFSRVRIFLKYGTILEGVVLPKPETASPDVIVLKLPNGYNVGIRVDQIERFEVIGKESSKSVEIPVGHLVKSGGNLPRVRLVATGGTIMSKVDYVTGAVYPSFSLEDLYELYPELRNIASIELLNLMAIFSEDFTPETWSKIAESAYKAFLDGVDGVVILHGTDTMHYTSAALAFALRNIPGPVALVGSQRSSDRPSSDAFENLLSAVLTCIKAPFGESVIVMHYTTNDGVVAVHRGTKVRKMHTSRRDAFVSINSEPIAFVYPQKLEFELRTRRYLPRNSDRSSIILENKFDNKVALVKFYPGMDPEIIHYLIDKKYHGIVIEGTGFGHVRKELLEPIRRAIEEEIPVVIASQTIFGRVNLNVYRRGVELLKIGVIPAEDMHPETAYVKLCWTLAKTRNMEEVRKIMLTPIAFEINPRSEVQTYITKLELDRY